MDCSQFHVWTETDKIYIYSPVPPYEMAKPVEGKDKLENSNREIYHDIKNEKVAVIVENIQITEIW